MNITPDPILRTKLQSLNFTIPWWKKVWICRVLNREKWKLAHAHDLVAASLLFTDNHELGAAVWAAGDKLWADIYLNSGECKNTK